MFDVAYLVYYTDYKANNDYKTMLLILLPMLLNVSSMRAALVPASFINVAYFVFDVAYFVYCTDYKANND